MKRLSSCAFITAIAFAACLPNEPTDELAPDPVPVGEASTPLTVAEAAKEAVDEAFAIVRAHPHAHPEALLPYLRPSLARLEQLPLTPAQQANLQAYVESSGQDVLDIVESWGAQDPDYALVSASIPPPPGGCLVECLLFFLIDCNTSNFVGGCFGIWDCSAGTVVECNDGNEEGPIGGGGGEGECPDDYTCPPGEKCATWVFKPNECVETCDDDSDCPGDQKCKKPLGTSFKRCK